MKNCQNLYLLSTIACQLSECLTASELNVLSANLTVLGDMLESILACQEAQTTDTSQTTTTDNCQTQMTNNCQTQKIESCQAQTANSPGE